jgi:hypothetical protein
MKNFAILKLLNRYGQSIGSLSVYTRVGTNSPSLKWTKKGNKGNIWLADYFSTKEAGEFVVIFEGTHGGDYTGDIAIDDITVWPERCDIYKNLTTIDPAKTTTIRYPNLPLSCDFENGYCSWSNDTDADFSWLINNGQTLSDDTGPLYDHTLENSKGKYLYIEVKWNFILAIILS